MHTIAAAGAGFLLAVLWFDLMFDVQTRKHTGDLLPPEVLASISAYYRRVERRGAGRAARRPACPLRWPAAALCRP